jgi:protein-tyrosine phosphatase
VAADDGITHIVATPHCNDEFDYHRDRYTEMLAPLSDAAQGRIRFSLGCDFRFSDDNIDDLLQTPQRYTIGDTRYLLVEFSNSKFAANVGERLEEVVSRGLVPIITHPERNLHLQKHPEKLRNYVEKGCLIQVTATAFTGFWGPKPQRMAEWLLEQRMVHVLATDAHEPERRKPVLSEARDVVAQLSDESLADLLVSRNPAAIVGGRSLPKQTLSVAG